MPVFCDEDGINKRFDSPHNEQLKNDVSTYANMSNLLPWTNVGSFTNFEPRY